MEQNYERNLEKKSIYAYSYSTITLPQITDGKTLAGRTNITAEHRFILFLFSTKFSMYHRRIIVKTIVRLVRSQRLGKVQLKYTLYGCHPTLDTFS